MTLFANILQNPNDARARSDVKLMNVVVNFLSTLVSDESNGSIKRMLGVCGEFERIAQVVLDKAEKDSHSKKKRKAAPDEPRNVQHDIAKETTTASTSNPNTTNAPPTTMPFSPPQQYGADSQNGGSNVMNGVPAFTSSQAMSGSNGISNDMPGNIHTVPRVGQDFANMLSPNALDGLDFGGQAPLTSGGDIPITPSFQQPFVPQDLWQMPMTIEWDWADMSTNFPVFDSGPNH